MFSHHRVRKPVFPITDQRQVQVDGYSIRYQVIGEGEPLVLVHGLSGSSYWWVRNIESLARSYTVYLLDLPGFGAMRSQRQHFVLTQAATWILHWMQAVGLKQAHFIGHSMGGFICSWLAAEQPEVVSRLILAAPALLPQKKTLLNYVFPLVSGIRYVTPVFLPLLAYDALRAGPATLLRAASELMAYDIREKLRGVRAPTLLLWGEHDTLVPPALGRVLRDEMEDARLIILKRAGHVCMFDQAGEFNKQVLMFLQTASAAE